MHRLDVLLQAEVVCATLSGSGAQFLAEAVMKSEKAKERVRKGMKGTHTPGGIGTRVLKFDAVVMVRLFMSGRHALAVMCFGSKFLLNLLVTQKTLAEI